jgi:hypothetical protein
LDIVGRVSTGVWLLGRDDKSSRWAVLSSVGRRVARHSKVAASLAEQSEEDPAELSGAVATRGDKGTHVQASQ